MCSDQEIVRGWNKDTIIGPLLATNENLVYCILKSSPQRNTFVFYTRQKTLSLYYINSICDLLGYKQHKNANNNNIKNIVGSKNVLIKLNKKGEGNYTIWIEIHFAKKYKNVLKFKNDNGAEIRTISG